MDPRGAALSCLLTIERTPTHLSRVMEQTLGKAGLSPRDQAFAAKLVFTVLRNRLLLDHLLANFVTRPLARLQVQALNVLRIGAAELCFLNTPSHAAVDGAVKVAKRGPARKARGLVNAALRAFAAGWSKYGLPRCEPATPQGLAIKYSHPQWMVEELLSQFPPEECRGWLASRQEQPPVTLRVNTIKCSLKEAAETLGPDLAAAPHPTLPQALVVTNPQGPPNAWPGFSQGMWQTADAGAQLVCHLAGVRPGMRVADLCAGAGGKTGHLAALMDNWGRILAVEPSPGRYKALAGNLARLGVGCAKTINRDARALPRDLGLFDLVLVDAPCSGLGTTGRRPDLRWRRKPEDLSELADLQASLLAAAAKLVKPGGALLYATCTFSRRENQEVVERFLARHSGFIHSWDFPADAPGRELIRPDGYLVTYPQGLDMDGFFAARLVSVG